MHDKCTVLNMKTAKHGQIQQEIHDELLWLMHKLVDDWRQRVFD